MINEWIVSMPIEYSDETVEHYFETVKAGGNYMQRTLGRNQDGTYKFFNTFIDAEKPKIKKKQRRYLNSDSMINVLKACRGAREIALISTLIDSTCRIGDLAELKGQDINENYFISPKGKTGELRYGLDARICKQLKKMAGSDSGYVFTMISNPELPAKANNLAQEARKIVIRSGLTGKKLARYKRVIDVKTCDGRICESK